MSIDIKRIDEKQIYLLMKKWDGGKLEFIGAYWTEEMARKIAASNVTGGSPYITLHAITLHGSMIDKV